MVHLPASQYIELRNEGYYLAGTRISLDSVAWGLRGGQKVDEILADFLAIRSHPTLEGAVAFIEAHPEEIEAYLEEGARQWEEARKLNPPHLVEKVRRYLEEKDRKTA